MSGADAVERVDESGTVDSLTTDLHALGVRHGGTLLAHSSLSSLGRIVGGPQVVVGALQTVPTSDGTLVMPTHTGQYTDPSVREDPPVPDNQVGVIGESVPLFHPDVTPIRGMGAVPECFRNYLGVVHGEHPTVSFAAWDAAAEKIVGGHELDYGLDDGSSLARVYDRSGDMPLLGVDYGNNASLHLAEHHADFKKTQTRERAPLLRDDERAVVEYGDIEVETDDFEAVGEAFERQRGVIEGPVAAATATLLGQSTLVDFTGDWFESNR